MPAHVRCDTHVLNAQSVPRDIALAYAAAPVSCIREGYRSCELRDSSGGKLPLCTLLAAFEIVVAAES